VGTRVRPLDGPPPVDGGGGTGPGRAVEPAVDLSGREADDTERPVGCGVPCPDEPEEPAGDGDVPVRGVRPVVGRPDGDRPGAARTDPVRACVPASEVPAAAGRRRGPRPCGALLCPFSRCWAWDSGPAAFAGRLSLPCAVPAEGLRPEGVRPVAGRPCSARSPPPAAGAPRSGWPV